MVEPVNQPLCRDDGIGRHAGLKIQWAWKTRTGSSPVLGTNYNYNNSRQASWVIIIIYFGIRNNNDEIVTNRSMFLKVIIIWLMQHKIIYI